MSGWNKKKTREAEILIFFAYTRLIEFALKEILGCGCLADGGWRRKKRSKLKLCTVVFNTINMLYPS